MMVVILMASVREGSANGDDGDELCNGGGDGSGGGVGGGMLVMVEGSAIVGEVEW